jgi:hypothetical protein
MRTARALTPRDQSGTPMTQNPTTHDIPSYDDFIKSHAPRAPKDESLGDIVAATAKTLARCTHAIAQTLTPQPDEDRAAQIESVQDDMERVRAEFADPRAQGVQVRIACDLLRLYRACPRVRCRRAESCRGHASCIKSVEVPEPVFRHVAWVMMAARLPWITSGRADQRLAYESWVAGMEAGASARCVRAAYSARPRESGDPVLGPGFPLARE